MKSGAWNNLHKESLVLSKMIESVVMTAKLDLTINFPIFNKFEALQRLYSGSTPDEKQNSIMQ